MKDGLRAPVDGAIKSFEVTKGERAGVDVRVTSLERTLVDLLDRPDLGGGWEEIWRSLESVEFYDLDRIVEYVTLLENSTTTAKVGFFQTLEQGQVVDQHGVELQLGGKLDELLSLPAHGPHRVAIQPKRHAGG